MAKTKIMIEVSGGVVQSVTSTKDIEIFIVDHDSLACGLPEEFEKAGTCYSPDCVCKDEEFELYVSEAMNDHEIMEDEND